MNIEPIELWLDPKALRRGLIFPVDPDTVPNALLVQDSGMVPVQTQVAIVNPETNCLCHAGEYGEIWVESEACVKSFYGSKDPFDAERFSGKTADGDPRNTYVRTGDLGFLHTVLRPIGPGGAQVEMQILFVLGGIGETFEVNGLAHFPIDIESSVERCHRYIISGGRLDAHFVHFFCVHVTDDLKNSAVFQAGGLVVVLVEVKMKSYLASIVPVIVNAILDQHQLIVDIVAFVGKGDFPRSRLGEKQRGKILASWVTQKMRTIAQFGIRDTQNTGVAGQAPPSRRGSIALSMHGGIGGGGSHHMSREETILETPTMTRDSHGRTGTFAESQPPVTAETAPPDVVEPVELPALAVGGFELHTASPPSPRGQTLTRGHLSIPMPPPRNGNRAGVVPQHDGSIDNRSASTHSEWEYPSEAIMAMKLGEQHKDRFGMAT
jgi:hypothetical protein